MSQKTTVSLPVYNFDTGKEYGKKELSSVVFGARVSPATVHQVIVSLAANRRQSPAHTKTKSEVSGGGKKPWKQKGTGRARQGSTRNPQWRGGGKAHGPRNEKNYEKKINKAMMRAAMKAVLTDRAREGLILVDKLITDVMKTKNTLAKLSALPMPEATTLIVVAESDPVLARSTRNLPRVALMRAADVGVEHILGHQRIVMATDAADALTKRLESTRA